jgi:Skp family chaperone for outer membrane proteins
MTDSEDYTGLERTLLAQNRSLEQRLNDMEAKYDQIAADLIHALDDASAYRAKALEHGREADRQRTLADYRQAVNEKRSGKERRLRQSLWLAEEPYRRRNVYDRRKSWPL